jgi:hypothetical protein
LVTLQGELAQQQQVCHTETNENQVLIETKDKLLGKAKHTLTDNIVIMERFSKAHETLTVDIADLNSQITTKVEDNSTLQAKFQDKIQAFAGLSQELSNVKADDDKDSVVNLSDKCPNTPKGTYVDVKGCPADIDRDGITDNLDKCAFTPAGLLTNEKGCEIDSDNDGIVDSKDQCPASVEGIKVLGTGCEADTDNDDIANSKDKCPSTVTGSTVDNNGCEVDTDKDTIRDSQDK